MGTVAHSCFKVGNNSCSISLHQSFPKRSFSKDDAREVASMGKLVSACSKQENLIKDWISSDKAQILTQTKLVLLVSIIGCIKSTESWNFYFQQSKVFKNKNPKIFWFNDFSTSKWFNNNEAEFRPNFFQILVWLLSKSDSMSSNRSITRSWDNGM